MTNEELFEVQTKNAEYILELEAKLAESKKRENDLKNQISEISKFNLEEMFRLQSEIEKLSVKKQERKEIKNDKS